ncbi:unnamed protein product [Sphacelaria rigidula]
MFVPDRPGVIIRAPEREKSKEAKMDSSLGSGMSQEVADRVAASARGKPRFVVYTNTGVCPHGDDLVAIASKRGLLFNKIDVSQTVPPGWLPGTPSVVHEGDVYCGDAAFSFVEGFPLDAVTMPSEEVDRVGNPDPQSIIKGKVKCETAGCGIKAAFAPPKEVDVDESQFNVSTEDMMQKLLAGRRS